ncbi:MAG TPA: hypothetical protein VFG53_16325 [Anaeromyxobacter sp.]|nr:hypothetical protein [Anaeromyxobacter sp.]
MHRLGSKLAALSMSAAVFACSAQVSGTAQTAAQTVSVAVEPAAATLATGQATQFAAVVTGTADVAVTWQVDESGGGTVSSTGLYTAPNVGGTYHVRAVSQALPSVSGVATVTVTVPAPGSVVISPKNATVLAGGTATFTATVTNLANSSVTWSIQETSGCGSISAGVYTAPGAAATCHVVATSVADATKTDVATVIVTIPTPVVVTVTPSTGTVDACRTLTFSASVSGTTNQAVAWSVAEGSAGGSVSASGVYTAPSSSGTYHVVATSQASASSTAQATVTVQDHILSVTINPVTTTLTTGGTQQFTATVTTTCGNFAAQ